MTAMANGHRVLTPVWALNFLMEHFKGYELQGGIRLPMMRPTRPLGLPVPRQEFSYGMLLMAAVKAIDKQSVINRIEIGGFNDGLQLFDDERLLFAVGDAFLVGGELPGMYPEQAHYALEIVQTVTGLSRDLLLEPITGLHTRHVTLRLDGTAWDVDWRV